MSASPLTNDLTPVVVCRLDELAEVGAAKADVTVS